MSIFLIFALVITHFAGIVTAEDIQQGSISGRVVDEGGNPISDAWVCAEGEEYGWGSTYTDEDGYYTIYNLEMDDYRVRVEADGFVRQYFDGVYRSNDAAIISITGQEVNEINFILGLQNTL